MTSGPDFEFEWSVSDPRVLGESGREEMRLRSAIAHERLERTRHPDIPAVDELHLPLAAPARLRPQTRPSPGLASPLLEEARQLRVHSDYKYLSDLQRRTRAAHEHAPWAEAFARVAGESTFEPRRALLRQYIEWAYEPEPLFAAGDASLVAPRWTLDHPDAATRRAFAHVEGHWGKLLKACGGANGSSLIQSAYPFLIPAGRFRESYYWDTCFGVDGLLATGRNEAARMQAENLLEAIRRFGFMPNGMRDYYLSRSQAPLSASMIRKVVEASSAEFTREGNTARLALLKRWTRERAVPLLEREFKQFWCNPATRFDAASGLHRHWDELDIRRPERFSADDEEHLGASYRDVRAAAESGLDFTDIYRGPSGRNEMSQYAPVLLNAVLCRYAQDLAWLAGSVNLSDTQREFLVLAQARSAALNRHLWDEAGGVYRNYHLRERTHSAGLCFTVYAPLYAGACTPEQAARVVAAARVLEARGGVAASTLRESTHQWDGANGWAPAQMIAVEGLMNYGYAEDARRLATKWTATQTAIFQRYGQFFERADLDTQDLPGAGADKYPVQEGFLWSNASYAWMLTRVLGHELRALDDPHPSSEAAFVDAVPVAGV